MARRLTYELCKQIASTCRNSSELGTKDASVLQACYRNGWVFEFFPNTKNINKGRDLSYDYCKKVASTCKNAYELQKKDASVYRKAYKNHWLRDFFPDTKFRNLDYDTCHKSEMNFKSRTDFKMGDKSAYEKSYKEHWLDDFFPKHPRMYSFTNCRKSAMQFKNATAFHNGDVMAWRKSKEMGWVDIFFPNKERRYTDDEIIAAANDCKTLTEFRKNHYNYYQASTKRGLLNTFTWLVRYNVDATGMPLNCIYAYLFNETHRAYIGITINKKRRHTCHKRGLGYSPVYEYSQESGLPVPEPIYVYNNITTEDACRLEQTVIDRYAAEGWVMLNTAKGGSAGTIYSGKWSKQKCIEFAKDFEYWCDFEKQYPLASDKIRRKQWFSDVSWLIKRHQTYVPSGFYDSLSKEQIHDIAKKYKNRTEFCSKCIRAYKIARDNKWLNDWFPKRLPYTKMTKEQIHSIAMKYASRKDFRKGCKGAYEVATDNNWLTEWFGNQHKGYAPRGTYTEMTKEQTHSIAMKYASRTDFKKGAAGAYTIAFKNKWLNDWFPNNVSHKPVNVFEREGKTLIGTYPTINATAKAFGCTHTTIQYCCSGKTNTAKGKVFRYAK